ncbi:unnamed protein product [Blepharisma stoltei]|uniref:HIT-type domain-containing protein n=1 Tax=Blepharisma stoltei TaxID=1481888 RepID=A0AAU9IIX2_9CILI|nr:unnamed protein product [Blepharisma stoltei]
MESWIDKFFPSCCARGRPNISPDYSRSDTTEINSYSPCKVREEETIDILSPKLSGHALQAVAETDENKLAKYITIHEISPQELSKNDKPLLSIEDSPVEIKEEQKEVMDLNSGNSTQSSSNSMDKVYALLDNFKCANCSKKAAGWCTGCPTKRYCVECFSMVHRNSDLAHKFCKYKTKSISRTVLHALTALSVKKPKE